MSTPTLLAPFTYFGGKRSVASVVWDRLGEPSNYIEPFFGSGAVLLSRPNQVDGTGRIETVNDLNGFIVNVWRAVRHDPEQVASYADAPVFETDLHARHAWLVAQTDELSEKLVASPDYYDPKIAGWWIWGASCWIGSGWCDGSGGWQVVPTEDGPRMEKSDRPGISKQKPVLSGAGEGVHRLTARGNVRTWMENLSARLRYVRVCCGDWQRVCTPSVIKHTGVTGIFFDPPYTAEAGRDNNLYAKESKTVGHDVAEWCIANQDDLGLRIALAGYEGEYSLPGWECFAWQTNGGLGNQKRGSSNTNAKRERIWFSPSCKSRQLTIFSSFGEELYEN